MQKNWYIIYTKPKCEKKVASIFTKKKIEHFFPLNCKHITSFRRRKLLQEPLFESYVFANMEESETGKIRAIDGVVNFVYWKGKPAIVQEEEIEVLKEFTSDYQDIILEKTDVNIDEVARVIDGSKYTIDGHVLTVKSTTVKVNLPSIGFTLVAKVETENPLYQGQKVSFGRKDLLLQS